MTKAELIAALQNCSNVNYEYRSEGASCSKCPYKEEIYCKRTMILAAADAIEADDKRIAELEAQEPTEKQVVDYCRKRCLVIVEGELFQRMKATYGRIQKRGECEAKNPKTVKETEYSFYCDCPTCGERLINNVDGEWCAGSFDRFCRMCGQKIDWSEYCGWSNMPRGERTKGASDEH